MEGNIGGKLIWRLVVETKMHNFISTKFNIIHVQQCVGIHVRRVYRLSLAVRAERWCFLSIFHMISSVPKLSLSLTQKEKEVVNEIVSKAEKKAQHMGMTLCTQSKRNI